MQCLSGVSFHKISGNLQIYYADCTTPIVADRGHWTHLLLWVPVQEPSKEEFRSILPQTLLLLPWTASYTAFFRLLLSSLYQGASLKSFYPQLLGFKEVPPVPSQVSFIFNQSHCLLAPQQMQPTDNWPLLPLSPLQC